jgi:signal transduction histidine kinase
MRRVSVAGRVLIAATALLGLVVAPALAHNGKLAVARPLQGIVVDGDLSDWPTDLRSYRLTNHLTSAQPDSLDVSASARFAYDPARGLLLIAVDVTDQSIVVRQGAPEDLAVLQWFEEDGVEFYVGTDHDGNGLSSQYAIRGDRTQIVDQTGAGTPDIAFTHSDRGHTYEFSLDLRAAGLLDANSDGLIVPVDVVVVDSDAGDSGRWWLSWGAEAEKHSGATLVGDVLLVNADADADDILRLAVGALETGVRETGTAQRRSNTQLFLFVGIAGMTAMLHLLLFLFHRARRTNLHYAAFAFLLGLLWILAGHAIGILSFVGFGSQLLLFTVPIFAVCVACLRFLYFLFDDRLPRRIWILSAIAGFFLVVSVVYSFRFDFLPDLDLELLLELCIPATALEATRVIAMALWRRQSGARVVAIAFAPLIVAVIGVFFGWSLLPFSYVTPWLLVVMSIHLARDVARTRRELETQLARVRDLTAHTLRQNRQIEEASRNKSQFLRRMSHDLRSPMNAIIGYTRLLRRRLADRVNEREARNLANIETSSGNLLNLINDILDLSRVEAGRIEVNERPVDLRTLIEECADSLESIVREGVVLRRDLADVGLLHSDPDRLRQVIMNLIGNATKFTEEGTITLSLHRHDNKVVELSIADTGIGIPADDLPHIFDEFRQVERQGGEQSEGTGLGLAIAKKTVDLLGGELSATSEIGVGTTFTVRLGAS